MSSARWVVGPADGATVKDVLERAGDAAAAAEGRAFVGRRRVAPDDPVAPGDELVVHAARDVAHVERARVLVRRGGIVIADKPAGIPTASDRRGGRSLLDDVGAELGVAPARIHPASRLDVGVSGVVVLCLDAAARAAVERARAAGEHARVYVAIAAGKLEGEGTWDAPIGAVRRAGRAIPAARGQHAEPASTYFAVLAVARGATLLRLRPITGRTHQLRVHAAHAGAPLFGDREHGGPRTATSASGRVIALDRVALHAIAVTLPGQGGALVAAESPPPAALRALWNFLDGDEHAWDSASP